MYYIINAQSRFLRPLHCVIPVLFSYDNIERYLQGPEGCMLRPPSTKTWHRVKRAATIWCVVPIKAPIKAPSPPPAILVLILFIIVFIFVFKTAIIVP